LTRARRARHDRGVHRRIVIMFVAGLFACGDDDGGGGTNDGSATGETGTDSQPTMTSFDPTEMTQTSTVDTTATTSPDTDATDDATTTADTSAGTTADDASTSATTSASEDSGSSSGGEAQTFHLMNGDQATCDEPLWCYYNGNVTIPAGDPIEGQECFVAPIEPPFELIEMHYVVASTHTELEAFQLRIYARDGGAPTRLIEAIDATSVEASPIEHYYEIDPPIVIDSQEFCVGFGAFDDGVAASIGMAIDTTSAIGDVSYVRMEGSGECDIPDWEDATTHEPAPAGNWCIDATIRSIP
jgi:hypothetical protein